MRTVDAAGLSIGDEHPPRIMGVLNVSRESPYDPSVFADPGAAAEYVDEQLIDEGADIVDVGLESANKRFEVLSPAEELERLDTAVETIHSVGGDAVFSIETRYHEVAERALERGFEMVNDICGFADPEMPAVCRDFDVAVCKMASPPDLDRPGALEDVDDIYEALLRGGVTDKTIVDPAFGGWSEEKTLEDDRETFRRLREFRAIGRPILVSINRKNFLRKLVGRSTEEALPVSLAATSMAVERGAHLIRTHDVAATRDAATIGAELGDSRYRETLPDVGVDVEELDARTPREARRHVENDNQANTSQPVGANLGRLYAIRGLSGTATERLRAHASDSRVTVADSASVDGGIVLAGSIGALLDLATELETPAELEQLGTHLCHNLETVLADEGEPGHPGETGGLGESRESGGLGKSGEPGG